MPKHFMIKRAAVVLTFLALCLTNALTLTNGNFHATAHNLAESVFGGFVSTADSMMNRTKALRAENEKLTSINLELASENRRLAAAEAALRASYRTLELAHDLLRTRTLRLVDATHRLIGEHDEIRRKSEIQKAAAKRFNSRMFPRLSKSVGRSVSSLPARAVPWAGIAASVAFTTLDLIDACHTLEDLNAMNEAFDEAKHDDSKVCGVKIPTADELKKSLPR